MNYFLKPFVAWSNFRYVNLVRAVEANKIQEEMV